MKCPYGSIDINGKCNPLCREPVYQKNDKGECVIDIVTFIIAPIAFLGFISLMLLLLFKRKTSFASQSVSSQLPNSVYAYVIGILISFAVLYTGYVIYIGRTKQLADLVEFKYAGKSIYFDKYVSRPIANVLHIIENEFQIDLAKYTISTKEDCSQPIILSQDNDVSTLGAVYYICAKPI